MHNSSQSLCGSSTKHINLLRVRRRVYEEVEEGEGEAVYTTIDHKAAARRMLSNLQISVSNQGQRD